MILEQIRSDLKNALKEHNEKTLGALRMLSSAIKNKEIEKRPDSLSEEDILAIIKTEVKKLKDALEQFEQAGRNDLAEEYSKEIDILEKYLPQQMSEEEIRLIVKEKVNNAEDKNFGVIMKQVMAEVKSNADGKVVSQIVKEEMDAS